MFARFATALAGVWLMAAPEFLDYSKKVSDNDQVVGPLLIAFSIIAMAESTRNVRWMNILLAAWLFLAPWALAYHNIGALINDYATAVLVTVLSLIRLKKRHRFGGGWPGLWRSDAAHQQEAKRNPL